MAEGVRLVTFRGQTVTPVDDRRVYEAALGAGGVAYGCSTTIKNTNTLHIASGYGVLCGGFFTIEEHDISVQLSPGGTLLGRLYLRLDLSNAEEPLQLLIETGTTLTDPIQQEHVNTRNGIYEIDMAYFDVSPSTLSNVEDVFDTIGAGGGSGGTASSQIAPVEKTETASRAYAVGDYLIYGRTLYEVTAAIPAGGTLVVGTNLRDTTVGKELTDIHHAALILVETTDWSAQTTQVSGVDYYIATKAISSVHQQVPDISIGCAATATLPTEAEQAAYNAVNYVTYEEDSQNGMYLALYATAVPENNFYILAEGVTV